MQSFVRSRTAAGRRRRAPPALHARPPAGGDERLAHLVARNTADEVRALGLHRPLFGDLYHRTLTIRWSSFLAIGLALYLGTNTIFALLYLIEPGSIAHARAGAFGDAFFFSVETLATIGYGQMAPATLYGNLLMTIESAVGLLLLALTTGLIFARFSRPTARMLFSNVAVVAPHNRTPTLMIRIANQRHNQILAAEVAVTLVRDEHTAEGDVFRRFYDLKLVRDRSPIFALTFTVMHEIDPDSPLNGATYEALAETNAEIVVTAGGIDETLVQPVHARASYLPHEILWGHNFVDIIGWTADGHRAIDYTRFHDTVRFVAQG